MQQRGQATEPARIVYHCFDVLWLGARSTMPLPYLERRELLAGLGLQGELWDTPPHQVGGGAKLLARSLKEGKEGLIAKRVASPYRPGVRNDDWIKIKNVKRDEFVVAGYAPGEKIAGAGKLLLGYYAPGPDGRPALRFAGGVGTGFTAKERLQFQAFIDQHRSARNPFATRVDRDAVFTDRPFVVEVAYTEWTHGGSLRHPALVGLRPDKDPQQVTDPRVAAVER
jgi:bifunctional non-homologous end joining protein LigD